ncbi:MAG TPA: hypothetical protein DCP97_03435 [Ruminococcaceae bacterium]|nr:hypothetical protein [Oscillospiraceae bacterium]
MKLLLAQNSPYYSAFGGANKSNRIMLEELNRLGHKCLAVSSAVKGSAQESAILKMKAAHIGEAAVFECNGVTVHSVAVSASMDFKKLREHLARQIIEFEPDWVLVSSEDIGQALLETAIKTAPQKVIYLARTTLYLPFGPDCYFENPKKSGLLKKAAGVISVGEYLSNYIKKWGGVSSEVLPISLFGKGPFGNYGNFKEGYITMLNPCAYKGICIFTKLAEMLPYADFAAVPTWGTTSRDIEMLKCYKNIHILNATENIEEIYSKSRIVLVPSLWAEAKSRTIVEAMARGIPVLASDAGGNPEAKLGVEYVLPVNPMQGYGEQCDECSLPVAAVPEQNIKPWYDALNRLLSDEKHYCDISSRSRAAALEYISSRGGIEKVERYLLDMLEKKRHLSQADCAESEQANKSLTQKLTPSQQALLAVRLKQQASAGKENA